MDRKEAIEVLRFERDHIDLDGYACTPENLRRVDAYTLAIEALKPTEDELGGDT